MPTVLSDCLSNQEEYRSVIEVLRLRKLPATFQTLLIVQVSAYQIGVSWEKQVASSLKHVNELALDAFDGLSSGKIYWISAIDTKWRYGEAQDDGKESPTPLCEWYDDIADEKSYAAFQELKAMVCTMLPKMTEEAGKRTVLPQAQFLQTSE